MTIMLNFNNSTIAHPHALLGDWATDIKSHADSCQVRPLQAVPAYLSDHRFQDLAVLPGVAYLEMALACTTASRYVNGSHYRLTGLPITLSNVSFGHVLLLDQEPSDGIELSVSAKAGGFDVSFSSSEEKAIEYASLTVSQGITPASTDSSLTDARNACHREILSSDFYASLLLNGNQYGPRFQTIRQLWVNDVQALARIELDASVHQEIKGHIIHPTLLDGCIQSLAATSGARNQTFVLTGVDEVRIYSLLTTECWAHAVCEADAARDLKGLRGRITVYSASGEVAIEFVGVHCTYLDDPVAPTREARSTIAISATFTAEPLDEVINFWARKLETPVETAFAPFNQVYQQVLDPGSLLACNEAGLNVVLLRYEDWLSQNQTADAGPDGAQRDALLIDHARYQLPNGLEIAHLNRYETEYVYKEIFTDKAYLKHDIQVNDGDCIIDIGANIGLFTLWVQRQAANTTVYSFEPSPPVFEILRTNAALHGHQVFPHNLGVSDRKREAEFTYYEKSSVFSSFDPDKKADEQAIRAVVENMVRDNLIDDVGMANHLIDELMEDRLASTPFTCQLVSLSDIIRENGIQQVDLLKLDAEKSELPVLQGIHEADWPKIKQIVMEVHDREGPVIQAVTELLRSQGFDVAIEEETYLHNSGLFNIFAIRPQESARRHKQIQSVQAPTGSQLVENLTIFCDAARSAAARSSVPYLIVSCPSSPDVSTDHATLIAQMDRELQRELEGESNITLLSTETLQKAYPVAEYYDPSGDELGHVPYTQPFFGALGTMIMRTYDLLNRPPYKVIVLDCDNTLWQGVCGEDGPDGIIISEPYQRLQQFMLGQAEKGMLLCLSSKNIEEDVMAVFDGRTDMILTKDKLVSWRINWQPKSQNLRELASELQLGLESFIFLDDNPVECAEVQAGCPEVLTLQLPPDVDQIGRFLDHVWAFDHLQTTAEDQKRTEMYQQNLDRERYRNESVTLETFLAGLELDIRIETLQPDYLDRVSQLTQRTNQFNLTTIRRSTAELQQLCSDGELECLITHVSDRFGDYGLVGVMLFSLDADAVVIDTLLLSCRVLGRGVEHQMMAHLGKLAHTRALSQVVAPYRFTKKNEPALDFLNSVGAQFGTDTEDGAIYHFPVNELVKLSYNPTTNSDYAAAAMKRAIQPKTTQALSDTDGRRRSELANQIASELWQAEAITTQAAEKPTRTRPNMATIYVAPTSDSQHEITSIWQNILCMKGVGINDNFFEIGGTSLKGVQLIAQMKRQLDVDFTIVSLFEHPTIASMAQVIDGHHSNGHHPDTDKSSRRGTIRRNRQRMRRRR